MWWMLHICSHISVCSDKSCCWCYHSEAAISLHCEPVQKHWLALAVRLADHSEAAMVLSNDNSTQFLTSNYSLVIPHVYV